MSAKSLVRPLASLALALVLAAGAHAGAPDRLDRFRTLATSHLAAAQLGDETASEAYREIYALLDEEIVDSLASGGPFASVEFLQERLDAFTDAWGSTAARVMRAGRLLVGAFQLSDGPSGASVRVYGTLRMAGGAERLPGTSLPESRGDQVEAAALLTTLVREGRPTVHPLPPVDAATAQFLVAWEGPASGRGTRALRIEHVRQHGDGVRVVWSTASAFPEGLLARGYGVRGPEVRVRYELRYPGWTPGCDGQTEHEDVYRLGPGQGTFSRVARREVNAWHRNFRQSVTRLFSALSAGDRATLTGLVPDGALRGQLPRTLRAEPACDAADGPNPDAVSVAATTEDGPWQLTFHKTGSRWRLVRATPVIQ